MKRPDTFGRLDRERHRRRRHLVTPGTVITPQSANADGRPAPGRAQQAAGHGGIRNGALRRLRSRDAIAESANRVRPCRCRRTWEPLTRTRESCTHPASQSDRPRAKPTRPGRSPLSGPSSRAARLTCAPETLRHTGAASSNQPAPASRTARGISDLCRVIGGWRAEYPDRHRQHSDRCRLAVRAERRVFARNLSGATSRRVTGCRTAAIQRVASCVQRMPPGSQQGAPGGIRTLLPRLTWLAVLVRIVGPDPASFIHVAPRRKSGAVVT